MEEQIDPQIKNLVSAIGRAETGNNPNAYAQQGPSNEYGRYQYIPETWRQYSHEILGDGNAPMTVENQNRVTYGKVKQWKEQGYNPAQIASMWNAGQGKPNAYREDYRGINEYGVRYDTPAYAQKVSDYYNQLKGMTNTPKIQIPNFEKKPTIIGEGIRDFVRPFARLATNFINTGEAVAGVPHTEPFSGDYLGRVKAVGQEGTLGQKLKDTAGVGLELASNIPVAKGAGLTAQSMKQILKGEGSKVLPPLVKGLMKEGAFAGGSFAGGKSLEEDKSFGQTVKDIALGTVAGTIGAPLLGVPLSAGMIPARALFKFATTPKVQRMQNAIDTEVTELLGKTRGIINKTNIMTEGRHVPVDQYLKDPYIFRGLQVENGRINPDQAIQTVENRTERLMEAKTKLLAELDRFMPKVPKETIREKAVSSLSGTPLDVEDDIRRIDRQLEKLPDEMTIKEIDDFRAQVRKSARDARGISKTNEYTALEKGARDTVFEVTDNLPFDTNKEYQTINNEIKNLIAMQEFLDKTMRGQIVKGGRMNTLVGKLVGAIAGSKGGPITSFAVSEIGGSIANILTNRQLGNTFKMRLIRNLTDDPTIIREAEQFLLKAQDYKPPLLPPPSSEFRNSKPSGPVMPMPAKSPSTLEAEEIARIQAQRSQGSLIQPTSLAQIQTTTNNIPYKPIKGILSQEDKKVKTNLSGSKPLKVAEKPGLIPNDITPDFSLTGEDARIQNVSIAKYKANAKKLTEEYIQANGKVVNTDEARKLFKAAVHEASSAVAKNVWKELLRDPNSNEVLIYAGGSGTGKTSAVKNIFPNEITNAGAILDGNLSTMKSAQARIQESIDAGKYPTIIYVYRHPVDSWVNGVIKRMKENAEEGGRVVPLSVFIKNHKESYDVVKQLIGSKNNGISYGVKMVDNSLGKGNQTLLDISKFDSIEYKDSLEKELKDITKELYGQGKITKTEYEALIK